MDVAIGCPICRRFDGCACKTSLAQFIELISIALDRVSTHHPTSTSTESRASRALIDKLNFQLQSPITRTDLETRLNSRGLNHRLIRLRDRRWYFEVGTGNKLAHLHIGHPNNDVITRLISRPSAFASFGEYKTFLADIIPDQNLSSLKITRVDLAVDYPMPLAQFMRGLDVSHKRAKLTYTDNGPTRTGLLIGKGAEKLLVYDKAHEQGMSDPMTRIELQLSGGKLPTRSLDSMASALAKGRLFTNINLSDVRLKELPSPTEGQRQRQSQLDQLISREGLLSARQVLNTDRNFRRDFGSLLDVTAWDQQPSAYFMNQIKLFFNQTNKEENYVH
jgi:hypothetical protein